MKRASFPGNALLLLLLLLAVLFCLGLGESLDAQTPIPAQPVDPTLARPAVPVTAKPVTPSPDSTAPATVPAGPRVSVLADSSLRGVLQELAQSWADKQTDEPQVPLTLTNAGTLVRQVELSAAWDVILSADGDDMKTLTDKGLVVAEGQRSLARNVLVIYGRKALLKDEDLDWFDLIGSEWKRVAFGNPDLVESGRVARHALRQHGLFDDNHKGTYVNAGSEALVLQVAERDQADAVFVYRTDLIGTPLPGFEPVTLNSTDAPPVFYLAAVGKLAKNQEGARSFIEFCAGESARDIWNKYGFEPN